MSLTSLMPLVVVVVVVLILVKRGGAPWRKLRVERGQADTVMAANARMQARNLLAFGTGTVLLALASSIGFVALSSIGFAQTGMDLGRIILLAPLLAAAGAVTIIAIAPTATLNEPGGVRAADLSPRRPWDFGSRWLFALAAGLLIVLVVALVSLGLSADGDGRTLTRLTEFTSTSASPYPGFVFGGPILVAAVLLASAGGVALVRIAAAPRPTAEQLRVTDDVIRQVSTRLVLKLVSAAIAATLGVVLVIASNATHSIGDEVTAGGQVLRAAVPKLEILAQVEFGTGLILLALGVALLLWAVRDAARTPVVLESAGTPA
jgi:hypothetical protein